MKTVCAWCQKESGIEPKAGESHGICQAHMMQELAFMKQMIDVHDETLESLVKTTGILLQLQKEK